MIQLKTEKELLVVGALLLKTTCVKVCFEFLNFSSVFNSELTKYLDTPEFNEMCVHVDPISYRKNLSMPKMIVHSAGDEFFLPTDIKYFYDKLPGDMYLRMLPNAEHEMILQRLFIIILK